MSATTDALQAYVSSLGHRLAKPVTFLATEDGYRIELADGRRIFLDAETNAWDEPEQWRSWVKAVLGSAK